MGLRRTLSQDKCTCCSSVCILRLTAQSLTPSLAVAGRPVQEHEVKGRILRDPPWLDPMPLPHLPPTSRSSPSLFVPSLFPLTGFRGPSSTSGFATNSSQRLGIPSKAL
jgi:hypothetical protein